MNGTKRVYAGPWVRLMSHNLDLIVLLPLYYTLALLPLSNAWVYALCVFITLLYEVIFTASTWRGTPGKRWTGVCVQTGEGNRLSLGRALFRAMVKVPAVLTFIIGFWLLLLDDEKRSLHDWLARTRVVLRETNAGSRASAGQYPIQ